MADATDSRGRTRAFYTSQIRPLGHVIWWTGCVRYFRDGDGVSALFRRWHPLTWLTWIVALQMCGIIGEKVSEAVPMRLKPYWQERRDQIEWL